MIRLEELYGRDFTGLLSRGLDWMAYYSRFYRSKRVQNTYNPIQAVIAAAVHALAKEDIEEFDKINRVVNLSHFQYPYMRTWLWDDHRFPVEAVKKCLTTLAWLVVREVVAPESPFVAAVTGLEERYYLCGLFAQTVISWAKRNWYVTQEMKKQAPVMMNASTQTCSELTREPYKHVDKIEEMIKVLSQIGRGMRRDTISIKALLERAVETENTYIVDTLMKMSGDIQRYDPSISRLLHIATRKNPRVLKTLVWHGLDCQYLDEEGNAPLHIAVSSNDIRTVKVLTLRGANINQPNLSGLRPLHLASDVKIIIHLLTTGADIDAKTPEGDTALHLAVYNNNKGAIQTLMKFGAKPNALNHNGMSPLLFALQSDNEEMIKRLNQPRVLEKFWHVGNPLYRCTVEARMHTIPEVLDEEKIEDDDNYNFEPQSCNDDLQGSKKDVTQDEPIQKRQLHTIFEDLEEEETEDGDNCKTEPESHQNILYPSKRYVTKDGPIHKAVIGGRLGVVLKLLKSGVHVDTKGDGGYTPLQYAAKYGQPNIVRALLERGADINLGNDWNWTPLHHAAHYSRVEIAEILLDAGADTQIVDKDYGMTPLGWAKGNFRIIKLFDSKGIYK